MPPPVLIRTIGSQGGADLHFFGPRPYARRSYMTTVSHGVPVYLRACAGTKLYCLVTKARFFEQHSKTAEAGTEPAISGRKCSAITTAPPSHTLQLTKLVPVLIASLPSGFTAFSAVFLGILKRQPSTSEWRKMAAAVHW